MKHVALGRINRKEFAVATVIMILVSIPLYADFDYWQYLENDSAELSPKTYFYLLVSLVISAWSALLSAKRFHDVSLSGWWVLLFFVPLLNFGTALYLLFKRPAQGENKYGLQPVGLSWRRMSLLE